MKSLLVPITGEDAYPAVIKLILRDLMEKMLTGTSKEWRALEKGKSGSIFPGAYHMNRRGLPRYRRGFRVRRSTERLR
jgi:hypothetical protein